MIHLERKFFVQNQRYSPKFPGKRADFLTTDLWLDLTYAQKMGKDASSGNWEKWPPSSGKEN